MNLADFVILGILIACAAFVIVRIVKRKKRGGGCAGCSECANCSLHGSCSKGKQDNK